MKQLGLEFFVFYHDSGRLAPVIDGISDPRLKAVDLNDLVVPPELRMHQLDEDANRALFSEYLGHYLLPVRGTMVGTFTYSVPLKFSREWAERTGIAVFADPPLTFELMLGQAYEEGRCYGVELSNPFRQFPRFMDEVHEKFRVGPRSRPEVGPYKGSVVVDRRSYEAFQYWLRDLLPYFLRKFPWEQEESPSSYSASEHSGKSDNEIRASRYRWGLGVFLEQCMAYYFGQVFRDRLTRIGEAINDNRPAPDLTTLVRSVQRDNTIIIAFANQQYDLVLRNWIAAARRCGVDNFLVIALDPATEDLCLRLNRPYYRMYPREGDFKELMRARVRLFRDLSAIGVDFINSDIDAIWMQDPQSYLRSLPGDILISQGTIQPPDLHAQWGFTLCSGFFMSRASERMRLFYELMIEDDRGDQISLNHVLADDNIRFDPVEYYEKTFRNKIVKCSREPIVGRGDNFAAVVLPHHLFQRMVEEGTTAYVKHPLAPKSQPEKLRCLRELDCLVDEPAAQALSSTTAAG